MKYLVIRSSGNIKITPKTHFADLESITDSHCLGRVLRMLKPVRRIPSRVLKNDSGATEAGVVEVVPEQRKEEEKIERRRRRERMSKRATAIKEKSKKTKS